LIQVSTDERPLRNPTLEALMGQDFAAIICIGSHRSNPMAASIARRILGGRPPPAQFSFAEKMPPGETDILTSPKTADAGCEGVALGKNGKSFPRISDSEILSSIKANSHLNR